MIFQRTERSLPLIAVSACLLGHNVRYDGANKSQRVLEDALFPYVEVLPFCPEVGAGLSVPRPPVQLVEKGQALYALGRDDASLDITEALVAFTHRHLDTWKATPQLRGIVFKSRSPSCGLQSTPVYTADGHIKRYASGLYAAWAARELPTVLMVEESHLSCPARCADFLRQLQWISAFCDAQTDEERTVLHDQLAEIEPRIGEVNIRDSLMKQRDVTAYLQGVITVLSLYWRSHDGVE